MGAGWDKAVLKKHFGACANAWKGTEFKPQLSTPARPEEMTLTRKILSPEISSYQLLP